MRHPHELAAKFRSNGLRVTPQRQLLFQLLYDNDRHPTAESLYLDALTRMPGISLRTVYQTLTDLESMGEVSQLSFDNGAARFDPNMSNHHHAMCNMCGSIIDIDVDHLDGLRIRGDARFSADSAAVVFRGTCETCETSDSTSSHK